MTKRKLAFSVTCLCLLAALALATPGTAQPPEGEMPAEMAAMMEAYMKAGTPGEPHEFLAQTVGKWKVTSKMWMGPGEPQVSEATSVREMILNGRFLQEKFEGTVMGMPFQGIGITGYDNVNDKYWATWMDSMTTWLTTMEGERDGDTVVWHGEGPDPMTGGTAKMKMVATNHGKDKTVVEFYEMHGGEEVRTMELTYERQ